MKNRIAGIAAAIGMLILILDSRTALFGAAQGMDLCLKTVVPTLFPFILLSGLLSFSSYGKRIPLLSRIAGLFHIPDTISYLMIPTFLGGYPVGAQSVHHLYAAGIIKKDSAERMLAFCSNVGPSFLFGILSSKFSSSRLLWDIWIIQILAVFSAAQFFPGHISVSEDYAPDRKGAGSIIELTVKTLAKVCAWIILFRIANAFLERWFLWLLPSSCKVALIGFLELSNGCCILDQIRNESLRFIVSNGLLAFGGICVLYQTAAVCTGLRIRYYVAGKLTQMLCAVTFAFLLQVGLGFLLLIGMAGICCLSLWKEKKSSNPTMVVV